MKKLFQGEGQRAFPYFFFRDSFEEDLIRKINIVGDLKTSGESLMRVFNEVIKTLDEQKDKLAGIAGQIKSVAEQAEKIEEENKRLREDLKKQAG